jgi:hypothetical protein
MIAKNKYGKLHRIGSRQMRNTSSLGSRPNCLTGGSHAIIGDFILLQFHLNHNPE